jgi:ribonuclease P protein component
VVRAARLRRSVDIAMLRADGRWLRRASFVVRVRRTRGAGPRLAVTSPRSVGRSVVRNRARRRVREAFRLAFAATPSFPAVDLLVSTRPDAATAEFAALREDALSLLREAAG